MPQEVQEKEANNNKRGQDMRGKGREMRRNYTFSLVVAFAAILAVSTVIIIANQYAMSSNHGSQIIVKTVIPDSKMVDDYCKNHGYKYGWLDTECGLNKVRCYREQNGWSRYDCVEWNK